ncbi:hypothetical protein M9H77_19409 [Catharanthus roseus]|uniref:Uncharacterized protein n=1 Tax=Catharanthus roseus TaxID=4058 RepID=A0ACC0BA78_CATRO|nr:hypothetical protein M9H77_19409 [Catharanthus roseus]
MASVTPDMGPPAWRPPPRDSLELLYLHINQSDSTTLTTLGLKSRRLFEICGGEIFRGRHGLMRATGTRSRIIRIAMRIKPNPNGIRGTGLRDGEDGEPRSTRDLTERFSRSKYLEEFHKYQKGEKKGEYVDYHSAEFWISLAKFHELQRKAEEDAEVSGIAMLDDLHLSITHFMMSL